MAFLMSVGERVVLCAKINAATPVTKGAAIDVPLIVWHLFSTCPNKEQPEAEQG
jgi:hypothetical protein